MIFWTYKRPSQSGVEDRNKLCFERISPDVVAETKARKLSGVVFWRQLLKRFIMKIIQEVQPGKKPLGRPLRLYVDNIDTQNFGVNDWKVISQDRNKWPYIVHSAAKNLHGL